MEQERQERTQQEEQQVPPPVEEREEQQEPEKPKKPMEKLLREWIIPFGLEVLVLLFIIKFLFFFVVVPSGSMIPTIDTASILFATTRPAFCLPPGSTSRKTSSGGILWSSIPMSWASPWSSAWWACRGTMWCWTKTAG